MIRLDDTQAQEPDDNRVVAIEADKACRRLSVALVNAGYVEPETNDLLKPLSNSTRDILQHLYIFSLESTPSNISDAQLVKWLNDNLSKPNYFADVICSNGRFLTVARANNASEALEVEASKIQSHNLDHTLPPRLPKQVSETFVFKPAERNAGESLIEATELHNPNKIAEIAKTQMYQLPNKSVPDIDATADFDTFLIQTKQVDIEIIDPRFFRDYKNIKQIGQGSFGIVLEAESVATNSKVAIKISIDPSNYESFQKERDHTGKAGTASMLHSVKLMNSGDIQVRLNGSKEPVECPFFVLEFIGSTLGSSIKNLQQNNLETKEYRYEIDQLIKTQLLSALKGLHSIHLEGQLHCDLKPANIGTTQTTDGQVTKILDYGMAETLNKSDPNLLGTVRQKGVGGSVAYMSPEQASNQIIDARSDVYAMGCVLYQMLKGALPFSKDIAPHEIIGGWLKRRVDEAFIKVARELKIDKAKISNDSELKSKMIDASLVPIREIFKGLEKSGYRITKNEIAEKLFEWLQTDDTKPFTTDSLTKDLKNYKANHPLVLIAQKAMSYDPKDRYQTADEMREDLERYVNSKHTIAETQKLSTSISISRHLTYWIKRNPYLTTLALSAIAAVPFGANQLDKNRLAKLDRANATEILKRSEQADLPELISLVSEYKNFKSPETTKALEFSKYKLTELEKFEAFLNEADNAIASANNRDKPLTLRDDPVVDRLYLLLERYDSKNPDWLDKLDKNVFDDDNKEKLQTKVNDLFAMLANRLLPIYTGMNEPTEEQLPQEFRLAKVEEAKQLVGILKEFSATDSFAVAWLTSACDAIQKGERPPVIADEQIPLLKTDADYFLAAVSSMDFDTFERDVTFEEMKKAFSILDKGLKDNPKSFLLHLAYAEVAQFTRTNEETGLKHAVQAMDIRPDSKIAFLSYVNLKINVINRNKDTNTKILVADDINPSLEELLNNSDLSIARNAGFAMCTLNRGVIAELQKLKDGKQLIDEYLKSFNKALSSLESTNLKDFNLVKFYIMKFQYNIYSDNTREAIEIVENLRELNSNNVPGAFNGLLDSLALLSVKQNNDKNYKERDSIINELINFFESTDNINLLVARSFFNEPVYKMYYSLRKNDYLRIAKKLKMKYPQLQSVIAPEIN
jgi:serine/threonine protein kinase